jgi:type III secretion protein J
MGRWLAVAALLALAGCGGEAVVHNLDEGQANAVVVALDEGGIPAEKRRDDAAEDRWAVAVPSGVAAQARRVLSDRGLPRSRAPGFAEVFGEGSMVPTPTEERALYLHALAGELSRTVEAIDGVVTARVHLALPPNDPLRPGATTPPRAAVLVKASPGARGRVEPLAQGVRALVAGAVEGLDAATVSVVVTEAAPVAVARPPAPSRRRALLAGLAGVALVGAGVAASGTLRARLAALVARGDTLLRDRRP